jgi:sugar-specific transcriptional regulator TrmB
MEEKIIQVLELIGLNKNEIKIYLDLLKHNNSSALDISKRTSIHRSNTYDAIRKLINNGFIIETLNEMKKSFSAVEPERIKHYLKQQENKVDEILPYLKEITKVKKEEDNISMIKGVFAVREALYDLLKLNKPINVYGASMTSVNLLGEGFLKEFHAERIKKKIFMRHIYDQTAKERVEYLNKLDYSEAKFFPKKYFTIASTNLCDDIVMMVVFSNPLSAIIIKNKEISEAYNKYFEILYRQAKTP